MSIRDRLLEIADDQQEFDRKLFDLLDECRDTLKARLLIERLSKQLDRSLTELVLEVLDNEHD